MALSESCSSTWPKRAPRYGASSPVSRLPSPRVSNTECRSKSSLTPSSTRPSNPGVWCSIIPISRWPLPWWTTSSGLLAIEYLGREDLGQVKTPDLRELPEEPHPTIGDRGKQLALEAARQESNLEAVKAAARFVDSLAPSPPISEMSPPVETAPGIGIGSPAGQPPRLWASSAQVALSQMMGDAPMCDECGHITVRNGSCFRCLNCGASLGCS